VSEENGITKRIERIASQMGINAMCRLMHYSGFEDNGEWFEPYDAYETRANGMVLTFDAEMLLVLTEEAADELIEAELESLQ
jgi:hypothetical protein